MFSLYKKQFSNPYYKITEDYYQFKNWAVSVKLPEEYMMFIQQLVMAQGEELEHISQYFPELEVVKLFKISVSFSVKLFWHWQCPLSFKLEGQNFGPSIVVSQ